MWSVWGLLVEPFPTRSHSAIVPSYGVPFWGVPVGDWDSAAHRHVLINIQIQFQTKPTTSYRLGETLRGPKGRDDANRCRVPEFAVPGRATYALKFIGCFAVLRLHHLGSFGLQHHCHRVHVRKIVCCWGFVERTGTRIHTQNEGGGCDQQRAKVPCVMCAHVHVHPTVLGGISPARCRSLGYRLDL